MAKKFWAETADAYRIVHHAKVIRDSMRAQDLYRQRNRKAQTAHRSKAKKRSKVSDDVSAYVSDDPEQIRTVSTTPLSAEGVDLATGEVLAPPVWHINRDGKTQVS